MASCEIESDDEVIDAVASDFNEASNETSAARAARNKKKRLAKKVKKQATAECSAESVVADGSRIADLSIMKFFVAEPKVDLKWSAGAGRHVVAKVVFSSFFVCVEVGLFRPH